MWDDLWDNSPEYIAEFNYQSSMEILMNSAQTPLQVIVLKRIREIHEEIKKDKGAKEILCTQKSHMEN